MSGLSTTAHIPPLFDDDKSFGESSVPTVGSTTASTITIRPDSRICLLGTRGSGKTSFLGGLAILDRQVGWNLRADGSTMSKLDEILTAIAGPGWPRETRETTPFAMTVSHEGQSLSLLTYDYSGNAVERVLRNLNADADPALVKHFTNSDVLVVMLDAERDVQDGNARVALLDALKHHFLGESYRRPRVAVVLTKADRVDGLLAPGAAERYLREMGEQFLAKIEELAGATPVFAVSVAGGVDDRGQPLMPPQPAGYDDFFHWLTTRESAKVAPAARPRKGENRMRKSTGMWGKVLIGLALVLGFLGWWRWPDYIGYRTSMDTLGDQSLSALDKLERTRSYAGLLSGPVDRERERVAAGANDTLQSALNNAADESAARKVSDEAKLTATWAPAGQRQQLMDISRKAYEKASGFAFARLQQLKTENAGWNDQARVFYTRYSSTPQVGVVRAWQAAEMQPAQREARNRISSIEIHTAADCQRKAAEIQRYLSEHGISHTRDERRRIARAVELADMLGQRQVWAVSFVSCGELKQPCRQWLRVLDTNGDSFVGVEGTPDQSGSMLYTDDVFLINWRPGMPLRIQMGCDETWMPFRQRDSLAASAVINGPLAIIGLLGDEFDDRVSLTADTRWRDSFATKPYARFRVRDLDPDDVRIATDYLYPGDRWKSNLEPGRSGS